VAPYDAEGLDWLAGQGEMNVAEWAAVLEGREAITELCERDAEEMAGVTPEQLVAALRTILSDVDADAVTERLGEHLTDGMAHALAPGVDGWVDDDFAFLAPWGFDLERIEVPVLVWQGQHDLMVPTAHGRWLGDRIPGVEFRFSEDEGHLSLTERRVPEVHAWLGRYPF
jgi:pimeloyl-ACP methyl ester carboxylesterase